MIIPSGLAKYRQIQPQCIYCDEKSFEKSTGRTKRKYKLAGYWSKHLKISDARLFYVSTSKDYKMGKRTTVRVGKKDYEYCLESGLAKKDSYYDTMYPLVMTKDEICSKTSDIGNGFKNVAKLKQRSFDKFLEAAKKIKVQKCPPIEPNNIAEIIESLTPPQLADDVLRDLHLII